MKTHDFLRVVYSVCFSLSLLVTAGGLGVAQAATYEGQWTKIILDKINASSIDLKGTATLSGPDLSPRSYNLPATITATRLAKLAKGFLRGGVYGIAIDVAMQNSGWVWDEIMKNWKKIIPGSESSNCSSLPYYPGNCAVGYFKQVTGSVCVIHDYKLAPPNIGTCSGPSGYTDLGPCGPSVLDCYNAGTPTNQMNRWRKEVTTIINPPQVIPATDQDIFNDGVKNVPSAIPNIITGLPDVLNTPTSQLEKAANTVNLNWPEIVHILVTLVNSVNVNLDIQNIIENAIKNGVPSLSPSDLSTLTNNNIDINTLIQAINNITNNTSLTTQQQQQINNLNNLQNAITTNQTTSTSAPTLEIPTDCDLIPFVCAWLEWYRGWLTEDPPPIPAVAVPIEDLSDFDPWPTDVAGSCPPPYQFSVFGKLVEVSYQPWCDLAILIAPLLMGLAWLFASYIILRVR